MAELYLRKVVLEILPQSGTGKKIQDLRIAFKVEKTNESTPNTAEINVYNLSLETRSLLESLGTRVKLSIGYEGLKPEGFAGTGIGSTSNVDIVCIGDVSKVTQRIETPDIITTIQVADGLNRYRNSRLEKGYPPNIPLRKIIEELSTAMGLAKGARVEIPDRKYGTGVALSGLARDHLTMLCESNGLEWSIQDETLQVIPKSKTTTEQAVYLAPDTGLVGSPNKTDFGVEFSSLVQPGLRPGRSVKIKSALINGTFKLRKVTHEGDNRANTFLSNCEATA